ncbi:unnamed protein product [Sphacelaria rigidula]
MLGVIESSLEAGSDMPAVSLWVACTLLCMAKQKDASSRGYRQHSSTIMDAVRAAAGRPRSFAALEEAAPMNLQDFLTGYAAAVAPPKSAESSHGILRSVVLAVHGWANFAGGMVSSCL